MSIDFAKVKTPARQRVHDLLSDLAWHSWKDVHRVGGVRYSARILELKRLGYEIKTRGSREEGLDYRLVSNVPGAPKKKLVKVFLAEDDAKSLLLFASSRQMRTASKALGDALASYEVNRDKL